MTFLQRLQLPLPVVADGATGTNLQMRGLPAGSPPESWLFEKPEEIVRLHQDFLRAGADLLLTCTFGASPLRLADGKLAGRAVEVNHRAVGLAVQAVEKFLQSQPEREPIFIAGSVGPSGQMLKPLGPVDEERMFASFAEQARALSEAGVDVLVVETQFDLKEADLAVRACLEAGDAPVVVSFSYDRGVRTMMGVKPSQMAAQFNEAGVAMLGVNCGRSLEENFKNLQELKEATRLPIWFKPNAGLPHADSEGRSVYDVTPEAMGAAAASWLAAGAKVVGGCCGTSPEHLSKIAQTVKKGN
jgi:5-methyltetrahydrofolate--homocysteine methyltransferase